jgi:hypothetical protein
MAVRTANLLIVGDAAQYLGERARGSPILSLAVLIGVQAAAV